MRQAGYNSPEDKKNDNLAFVREQRSGPGFSSHPVSFLAGLTKSLFGEAKVKTPDLESCFTVSEMNKELDKTSAYNKGLTFRQRTFD